MTNKQEIFHIFSVHIFTASKKFSFSLLFAIKRLSVKERKKKIEKNTLDRKEEKKEKIRKKRKENKEKYRPWEIKNCSKSILLHYVFKGQYKLEKNEIINKHAQAGLNIFIILVKTKKFFVWILCVMFVSYIYVY